MQTSGYPDQTLADLKKLVPGSSNEILQVTPSNLDPIQKEQVQNFIKYR